MKTYKVKIVGLSDFMYGKHASSQKQSSETHEQFGLRVWQEQIHQQDGKCFIQPFAFKNALEMAAKWLSKPIPGEGKKTFTKRFTSGVLVVEKAFLFAKGAPVVVENVEPLRIFAPSDGKRGSGKRVWRIFPTVHAWETEIVIHVLDDKISEEVLMEHLVAAGQFVGLGSMRVENGGVNGRFQVVSLKLVEKQVA